MDIRKILSECRFVDNDPASDVERENGMTIRKPIICSSSDKKKGKSKSKAVLVESKMNNDELSIAYIIGETPPKKKVVQFIKNRIEELLDEDD